MTRLFTALALSSLLTVVAFAASGCESMHSKHHESDDHMDAAHNAAMQATISAKSREYTKALTAKDMNALDRMWGENLVFINGRGQMQPKAERMADLRSGATSVQSVDFGEESVRCTDDDIAVSFSRCAIKGTYNGKDASGDYRCTIGWVRREGDWKIVLIQLTPIRE